MEKEERPRILVFAAGDKIGGGSGFQEMVEQSSTTPAILNAKIVAVVSNHATGGVYKKAKLLNVCFRHWPGPFTKEGYRQLFSEFSADYVMLSGWLKPVLGLKEGRVINIHPGPLPRFGGQGMYGHHVHEAVIAAFKRGEIKQSAVSLHFVNEYYDRGHGIVQIPVLIRNEDTAETLAARVLKVEHAYQSFILNEIVNNRIIFDGDKVLFESERLLDFGFINK